MNLEATRSLGKKAISEDLPAGREVRELEGFLELQSEIDRTQSISASGAVDWKKVQRLSEEILDKEGKDILVACYLSVALTRNAGAPGFLAGLLVLNDLVEGYWESLFPPPKRIRGRRNAMTWWIDQLKEILPKLDNPTLAPQELANAREVIGKLNRSMGEKDPEGPLLNSLIALVGALPVSDPEPPEETVETPPPAQSPRPIEPQESSIRPAVELSIPEEDPEKALEHIYTVMRHVSENLLESDPADFRACRYARMAVWDAISEIPESQDQVTRIPPPPHQIQSALESVLGSENHDDLVSFCETQQAVYPFWLELSFHEANALEKMGSNGIKASFAIKGEVYFLSKRLLGIESLAFSDNTPFLSPGGQEWLESLQSGDAPSKGGDRLSASTLLEPVRMMIANGRSEEAARRFEEIRKNAQTGQFRFLLKVEFLSEIAGKGRDFPVETLAASLLRETDRIGLDHWDPELSKRILPLLYRIFSQSEDPKLQKEAGRLMRRLVDLDISSAVETFQKRW